MEFRAVLGTLGAVAVAASIGTGAAAAEPAVVKIGSFTPPKSAFLTQITIPWLRKMERDSEGTLKFQEFWGGALIRSPRKQWEGLMNGIQDASSILPSYTSKLFPDFTFFDLPLLFQKVGSIEATLVGWKMFERGMLGGLDKVHVLAIYANDNGGLHFNTKITSLDQIKGFKMRVPGPKQAAVLKELGLTPVGMGAPQIAESLNRGVIQGALMGWSAIGIFRITPLIKSQIDLPLGVRSFFVAIRKPVYDKLPRKAKEAIAKNRGLDVSLSFGRFYEKDGLRLRTHTGPRNVVRPTKAEQARLFERFKKFHDRWIAETPDGANKYKAIQEILAKHRGSS